MGPHPQGRGTQGRWGVLRRLPRHQPRLARRAYPSTLGHPGAGALDCLSRSEPSTVHGSPAHGPVSRPGHRLFRRRGPAILPGRPLPTICRRTDASVRRSGAIRLPSAGHAASAGQATPRIAPALPRRAGSCVHNASYVRRWIHAPDWRPSGCPTHPPVAPRPAPSTGHGWSSGCSPAAAYSASGGSCQARCAPSPSGCRAHGLQQG